MAHITETRVGETTTTTGTGDLALGGALTAHVTLSSVCAVGDTVFYDCAAVDANGAETGDWEEGLGTYATGNNLTRTTVLRSSNANAAVNFSAGTKYVRVVAERRQVAAVPRGGSANQVLAKASGTDYDTQWASGAQNAFSTVAVSGQSNVVADTTSDTLTLAAGSNITITTDATTDTVTITSTGGSIAPLVVEDANTIAQRNGTTAQSFHVYNTYTDASNYERLSVTWATNALTIGPKILGTGANRVVTYSWYSNATVGSIKGDTSNFGLILVTNRSTGNLWAEGTSLRTLSDSKFGWVPDTTTPVQGMDTAIGRNAAGVVEVNNGTLGTFRDLKLRNLLAGGGNGSYVQTPSMTVANLAAAGTAGAGARAFVTDATATTFLSTVAGGGTNKVPVVSDGTNWLIG